MTGSELLIELMSTFGENGEPAAVIVIYTDSNDNATIAGNCNYTQGIGLARYAEHHLMAKMIRSEEQRNV